MGVLRRLAQKSPWRRERPGPSTRNWNRPTGTTHGGASARPAAPQPPEVSYSLDVDIGEVADGYHLIVRSICLTEEDLLFEYAFLPELTEEAGKDIWPNMNYGADVSPPGWNRAWSEADVYERPPPEARHAWFDFFRPDYEWMEAPDSEYRRNRIARLTFDLKTGEARIEK